MTSHQSDLTLARCVDARLLHDRRGMQRASALDAVTRVLQNCAASSSSSSAGLLSSLLLEFGSAFRRFGTTSYFSDFSQDEFVNDMSRRHAFISDICEVNFIAFALFCLLYGLLNNLRFGSSCGADASAPEGCYYLDGLHAAAPQTRQIVQEQFALLQLHMSALLSETLNASSSHSGSSKSTESSGVSPSQSSASKSGMHATKSTISVAKSSAVVASLCNALTADLAANDAPLVQGAHLGMFLQIS
jgi:hypothetical protein